MNIGEFGLVIAGRPILTAFRHVLVSKQFRKISHDPIRAERLDQLAMLLRFQILDRLLTLPSFCFQIHQFRLDLGVRSARTYEIHNLKKMSRS